MAIAFTLNAKVSGKALKVYDVTCLDADTGPTAQAHGMGITPIAWFTKHISVASAAAPEWALTVDGTNVSMLKNAGAGSGGAVPGTTVVVTVFVMRPHSLIQ